ncbi:T9SS type A sorting domain-containing protein [Flavitalea flava]
MKYVILIFTGLLCAGSTHAQIYNTGILYVGNANTLSSLGDFTNTATANYKNDGTVYLDGNVSNDQTSMPAGAGTTIFNGLNPQTLSGSAYFRSFNLTLNNTSGLTLSNRLSIGDGIGGTLNFTAGKITSGTGTQDVYFYPGSGYTGFDASHHIIGYTTKSGNTDFTFPIGDGTNKADLDLTALSAIADFQALYTGSGFGVYNTNAPLVTGGVSDKEWWDVQITSGSATARLTLKWNDARKPLNHSAPASLLVGHYTAGAWQSEGGSSADGAGSSTGTVGPSNTIISFSPFTFGSSAVALPILLSSFTGIEKDCQALLEWTTGLEANAGGFEIGQSPDGNTFTTVAFVKANGTPSHYQASIPQSISQDFYRIRLVDLDGNSAYSPVLTVKLNCLAQTEGLSVYPNPVVSGGNIEVRFIASDSKGQVRLQMADINGRIVYNRQIQVNSGLNLYTIPGFNMAKGMYTLFLVGDNWKTSGVSLLKTE